ncbi:MAG: hypothetical protein ACE5GI_01755 [Candidatus Aminicenantales bacterium]
MVDKGAGCFGYGENKQKGDNEGGLSENLAQPAKQGLILLYKNVKISQYFLLIFFKKISVSITFL